MAIFQQTCNFLPQKVTLMVLVKPSGDISPEMTKFLVQALKTQPVNEASVCYIPLTLDQDLKIDFSVSRRGTLSRDLRPCVCNSPVLPNQPFKSINNAYQKISGLFEQNRISQGGKVYEKVYFQDSDGDWKLIDLLRERIYQPYQADFEEYQRVIKERTHGYVKPILQTQQLFSIEIQQKEELVATLLSKTKNLQDRIDELNILLEKSKLAAYRQRLDEFKERLKADYPEAKGLDSWQEWIYKNNWLFGIHYGNSIGHPQVGFRSILDYLFPTPDGFIDILEIKKTSHAVIKADQSHPGAFRWSSEVNEAIGQVVNYLYEIELHQLEISKRLKQELGLELSTIKPRAFILIGKSDNWSDTEKEAFRRLNHSLHGIEVLTYTDLLRRAENLIKVYGD